ncbi:CHAD domain-containing protein [Roseibaca sp. Y0-43]|uniref:CHAD domain-containing protein n=1 Tax=Roseibaca sp. Y0-43 TaxID=2816854 RepID=UPI001D0C7760|nr:CHAD domain-containing protein [Roseibaca sp. Y0-43]MCC1480547.1 CHAD domain-containing protein [Roseibaca sp. Y0-43]
MKLAYPPDRPKMKPALQAVLTARAGMACAEVARRGPAASVFELRKRAKEMRGLLRLLQGVWEDAPLWQARIRDAAKDLAPARDAEVMLETFDSLTARRRAPREFDSLRQMLLDEIDICDAALDPDAMARFATLMHTFAEGAGKFTPSAKTAPRVWRNLDRTWAKGARAYAKAHKTSDNTEAFHDWRKWLKRHWYQARFFKPVDRAGLRAHIACVDALAKTLGAHNDLDVLHQYLRATCPHDPALPRLERDLLAARARHAQQALQMGAALYAAPAPAKAWRARWQAWRKG